jgi:hypothetical protein
VREVPGSLVKVDQDVRVKLIPDSLELVEGLDSALTTDIALASDVDLDHQERLVFKVLVRNKDDPCCVSGRILAHSVREEPVVCAHRIQDC